MKYTAICASGNLILAAMYLRRVGIDGGSYAAVPTQNSKVVTPPAPTAKMRREKKVGGCGDAAEAGDKQLDSCAARKVKYAAICVQWQVNPRGNVPSAS
jgi:hypothetical protein